MFSGLVSLLPGGGSSSGTVSLLPGGNSVNSGSVSTIWSYTAPAQNYPAPSTTYYSYQAAPGSSYVLPGTGIQVGPFGERGPYTPLDFPITRELMPGERLEDLKMDNKSARSSALSYLIVGIVAVLLLK